MTAQRIRHAVPSMLFSLEDEPWLPSPRLLQFAAMLAAMAPSAAHPLLESRSGGSPLFYKYFPGEHYHLLTTLCALLKPKTVWEFGTDRGMSTVAMLEGLAPEARIYTVDIDDWRSKAGPWLIPDDFATGRVTQLVCDMKSEKLFADHAGSLAMAELIFVDGPKDGETEIAFLEQLGRVPFRQCPIVVFDDIRLMTMVGTWRGIQHPKMDLTSFGHWSGTGLVEWQLPTGPQAARKAEPQPSSVAPLSGTAQAGDRQTKTTRSVGPAYAGHTANVLMLCHEKPNYVPDLLLHGLRKLLGPAVVDFPRKDLLYNGRLGQAYLDRIDGLMADDSGVDRSDIRAKATGGFFDIVLCDIRAISANRELLEVSRCPLGLIDGEDLPAPIQVGNYVILRRETDGGDFALPLPMAIPAEVLDWIDRHACTPKTHSIGFLGSRSSLTAERNAVLDDLLRDCPNALIEAWGVSNGKWQGRDAYYRALQGCKAVLTLPGAGFDTFRYWENAACNAAHFASRMPLFIPNDFHEGQQIVRFSDSVELAAAVERIEAGTIDWRALAEESRHWLRAHHTTEARAASTLGRLNTAFLR